ncbi:MAG: PEP-CTERM sorting domain-containing protein [Phycisphaeraceae bacterium]|nr:PEP-CTERM sorting domain-containing protein [Phycisphaeraceae bacterium]
MTTRSVLAALLLFWLTSSAWAATSGYINPQSGSIFRPVISGDWIAWGEMGTYSLYAKNIVTGESKTIVAPEQHGANYYGSTVLWGFAPWHPNIALGGDLLVWSDRRTVSSYAKAHIRSYNLATGEEEYVGPTSGYYYGYEHYYPSTDGQSIVWQMGDWAVGYADVASGWSGKLQNVEWPLAAVSGEWVIWKEGEDGEALSSFNLRTGVTNRFYTATEDQDIRPPVIDGSVVAWCMRDMSEGENIVKVMAYDLATGKLTLVKDHTGSPEHRSNVAVSGNIVIWEDWRNNTTSINRRNLDVWGFDLSTGEEFPVATGPRNQHLPWISGNIAVWVDDSLGYSRIGWSTLTLPAPEPGTISLFLGASLVLLRRRRV